MESCEKPTPIFVKQSILDASECFEYVFKTTYERFDSLALRQVLPISLIKSPPLGQHTEQEIISATFLGSMSNIIFLRTHSSRPL